MRVKKKNHLKSAVTEMKSQKKVHLKVNLFKVQLLSLKSSKKKRDQKGHDLLTSITRKSRMIGKISKRINVGPRI